MLFEENDLKNTKKIYSLQKIGIYLSQTFSKYVEKKKRDKNTLNKLEFAEIEVTEEDDIL